MGVEPGSRVTVVGRKGVWTVVAVKGRLAWVSDERCDTFELVADLVVVE